MPITVESTIDLEKTARAIPVAVREDLLIGAKLVIRDITDRIKREVKLSGHAQRQNLPKTQTDKRQRLGHHKPLIESGKLSRFSAWRINGVSPDRARTPKSLRLRIDHPLVTETTFGKRGYAGSYYATFLPHLERRGYRVPIGISRDVLKKLRKLAPAAFRAATSQGKVLGPVSPPQIRAFIMRQLGGRRAA